MIKFHYAEMRDPDYYGIRFHHIYHDYPTYHQHDFWEFFACLGGSYLHVVDGQKYVVNKFDACLLRPGVSHSMQDMVQGTSHFTIMRSEERRVGKECRSRWSP